MLLIRAVGVFNVVVGVVALLAPVKFYQFAMDIFTPDVSPPFSQGAVVSVTLYLLLPALVLIANGAALIALSYYLAGSGGSPVVLRTGEKPRCASRRGRTPGLAFPERRHEFIGMEIFDQRGNYYGKVEKVNLDERGRVVEFYSRRGKSRTTFTPQEIESSEDVILVRRRV